MAIDTAQKRRSASGVPFLPLGPGVTPRATKPAAWRRDVAWSYSGNAAGYSGTEWIIRARRRLRR